MPHCNRMNDIIQSCRQLHVARTAMCCRLHHNRCDRVRRDRSQRILSIFAPACTKIQVLASNSRWQSVVGRATGLSVQDGLVPGDDSSNTATSEDMLALLRRMLLFLLPVTALVLSEPLLNLCTSLFIGQFSTSLELAALGPANIVISFTHYVFASIQIATMSMLGTLLRGGDDTAAQQLLSSALGLALMCGILVFGTLTVFPTQLVEATGLKDPVVVAMAANFLKVRAVGQMGVLVTLVCQSAFLAQQDPVAPSLTGVLSTLVSVAGHVVLVGQMGWGLVGAAISTSVCNLTSAAALLSVMHFRGKLRSRIRVPTLQDVQGLLATMAPLSVKFISKNCCYIVIQTTATSILDVTRLAAHQAIFSAWGFCSFWLAPVEQAVLAMAPAAATPLQRQSIMIVGMYLGVFIGLMGGLAVSAVAAFGPGLLTQDAMLWPLVGQVALQALVSMVLTGVDVSSNAVNIVGGDVNYVAQSFVLTLGIVSAFMAVCRRMGWGFTGIWNGIVVFFAARALQSGIRAVRRHILAVPQQQQKAVPQQQQQKAVPQQQQQEAVPQQQQQQDAVPQQQQQQQDALPQQQQQEVGCAAGVQERQAGAANAVQSQQLLALDDVQQQQPNGDISAQLQQHADVAQDTQWALEQKAQLEDQWPVVTKQKAVEQ